MNGEQPPRRYPPGSEWLYAKIYLGPESADRLLRGPLGELASRWLSAGVVQRWFFVRYADPERHLRVRFRGEPSRLSAEVQPALLAALRPGLGRGWIWKVQLDTYDPETTRYGGPDGLALAEELFHLDSEAALELIAQVKGRTELDHRLLLALASLDLLSAGFGFDEETRLALLDRNRRRYLDELGGGTALSGQIGEKLRASRGELELLLEGRPTDPNLARGLAILRARGERLRGPIERLIALANDGRLGRALGDVAIDLIHMSSNRLLRSNVRAQELVIHELLVRLLRSKRARAAQAPRQGALGRSKLP